MGERSNQSSKLTYRTDIDGLRAIAVLLVIGDHFRTHVTGGYVGVDVFFVISGYLISAAILKELAKGTFSIVNFYERRIRRIFPALIVMLVAVCGLSYRYLFPTELTDFAGSLLAAMFSVSNFFFWHQAGYFDAPSAFKPLLHTWSLAVEEQFYIFFPIFLMLIRHFARRQLKAAILGLTALTFALAIFYVKRDATAAFFFSPLRAWELLIGTIISQKYLPAIRSAMGRNVATATGLLMILAPSLGYTATTAFPGLAALPPCVGAGLIIAGGETGASLVGRMLSLRPVVFVGLISYSLYLWHWPVLVFQNIGGLVAQLPPESRTLKLAMFAISIALGYLSWKWVETPFRKGRLRPGKRQLFVVNGIGVALVTSIGVTVLATNGLPGRFPADALQAASYLNYSRREPFREGVCFLGSDDRFTAFQPATCLAADPARKDVLILGDSQAAQLWFGMKNTFPAVQFLQATAHACPLYQVEVGDVLSACTKLAHYLHEDFLLNHHLDAVIFGGRWTEADVPRIAQELAWLRDHGVEVFLVGPMIEYDEPLPRVLATSLRDHRPDLVASHLATAPRKLDLKLAVMARDQWHVPYISYYDNLCTPDCPSYAAPGVPLLFDEHHLTAAGSILFAQTVRARNQLSPTVSRSDKP